MITRRTFKVVNFSPEWDGALVTIIRGGASDKGTGMVGPIKGKHAEHVLTPKYYDQIVKECWSNSNFEEVQPTINFTKDFAELR